LEAGGGLGGPAHTDVNFGGNPANLGAAPHDWGFAKKIILENSVEEQNHATSSQHVHVAATRVGYAQPSSCPSSHS